MSISGRFQIPDDLKQLSSNEFNELVRDYIERDRVDALESRQQRRLVFNTVVISADCYIYSILRVDSTVPRGGAGQCPSKSYKRIPKQKENNLG